MGGALSGSEAVGVIAVVHAVESAGCLSGALLDAAGTALARRAAVLDVAEVAIAALKASNDPEPQVLSVHAPLVVLVKPPGWVVSVHSAEEGAASGTSTDSGPQLATWLAGAFGSRCPIAVDSGVSHGLLHRLDRQTSGALLWACNYRGYYAAQLEFVRRRVRKEYVCLCHGASLAPQMLELPLRNTVARTVVDHRQGRRARTEVLKAGSLVSPEGQLVGLVQLRLHTGRQHQIRAHMGHAGRPLVADSLYGGSAATWCSRVFLHACRLALNVAGSGPVDLLAPLPLDLRQALQALTPTDSGSAELRSYWLEAATR
mmetsp:Transcript_58135/g.135405  ORF Transcript_58135/g.135405 Transcript_58135/m.135405 type:complete len:316 (-) Transcript_58135:26-973(-)